MAVIVGTNSNDKLIGTAAADDIFGLSGNDLLIGGAGADSLDGGTGTDTASYSTASVGVVANLLAPAGNTGDAAGDSYTSIENLTGSNFADTLTGDGDRKSLAEGNSVDLRGRRIIKKKNNRRNGDATPLNCNPATRVVANIPDPP